MTLYPQDPYLQWDAAYVLGALPPSERRDYEQHLSGCAECSAAVADLAVMPGLLASVDAQDVVATAATAVQVPGGPVPDEDQCGAALLSGLLAGVRQRRRRLLLAAGALMVGFSAATAGITLAVVAPVAPGHVQTIQAEGMKQLRFAGTETSLKASGSITPQSWGTRLDWTCDYTYTNEPTAAGSHGSDATRYSLVVLDASGHETTVASWSARPGVVVTPTATTSVPTTSIRRVDIRLAASGKTLLSAAE